MTSAILPGTVISAVDGSVDSRRGVRWAAEQAHLQRRPLMLVHATGEKGSAASHCGSQVVLDDAVAFAEEKFPDLRVGGLSMAGDPTDVLIGASMAAHLLVLGSRGRGRVTSRLLGSVGAEVAKHAACPVVVARPVSPGAVKDGVLVGADGTAGSVAVIEFAFEQASLLRLPLTVMHCVYDTVAAVVGARGTPYDYAGADEARLLLAESVAGLREKFPDVPVTTRVTRGLVEECLVAGPRPWNLIVVGRHPVHRFHGSVSTAVLERAHSVVAVVPESTSGLA